MIRSAFSFLLIMTLLTGFIYPLGVTALAQLIFPWQANGSLVELNGKPVGSVLMGQAFDAKNYFWGRPSATSPSPDNGANSSGSNMGPSNPDYLATVKKRVNDLQHKNPDANAAVPADLVTASGSGLDPDISLTAALYQVPRIAHESHISVKLIEQLVHESVKGRTFGILGEPHVNVLELNMALNKLRSAHGGAST